MLEVVSEVELLELLVVEELIDVVPEVDELFVVVAVVVVVVVIIWSMPIFCDAKSKSHHYLCRSPLHINRAYILKKVQSYQICLPVTAFQLQPSLVQQNFLPITLLSLFTRIGSFSFVVHDITPLCKKCKFANLFLFTKYDSNVISTT